MNKRGVLYTIFGLVFYLLFLIVEMPASWFAWGINYYTHSTVRLDPISGSLWHGKGRLVVYYPQTVSHDLGNTEWRINPLWLFAGRVQMHWRIDSENPRINTILGFESNQMLLRKTEITMPASALSSFYPPALLISPQGQVLLRTEKLVIGRDNLEGNAEIQWLNAASGLSAVQPLGNYRLEIKGTGQTAAIRLSTTQGMLELTGQGQWQTKTGKIQFTGSAFPRERTDELEPLLKLFGENQGNGRRSIALDSRLNIGNLALP
ncbi:MAG: type II secretion system protein N [Sulfuricaulis sp.]